MVTGWRSSPRLRALQMLWQASRPLTAAATVFVIAEGVLPNLALIMVGRVTGLIPGAVAHGLSSPAGARLLGALAIAGVAFGVSLLRGPAEDALGAATRARVSNVLQRRLVQAVSAPAGVGHLEDPTVLDQLSSAQGELMSYQPADAPMTLMSVLGDRLYGVLACVVLSTFRWWLGLVVLLMWLSVRRPLRALISSRVTTFRRAAEPLRRSWYLLGLAWRPAAAKELRVFGLCRWVVGAHRRAWLDAMTPSWHELHRLNIRIVWASLAVLATYALAAGTLGWAGYHREIDIRTATTMLLMLPASMGAGSVTSTDISLELMLSSLPDLDAVTAALLPAAIVIERGRTANGLPGAELRFEGVSFRYPGAAREAVSDLDLSLPAGHSLAIVGVNGAGKTTLVTLLARLRDPTAGRITVDGVPLAALDVREWQRQVAAVFQDFTRYPLSVTENIALNLLGEPVDQAALERAAELAGAADLIAELPRGWDTILSPQYERGTDLSGGQWQRIALARALYAVQRGARVLVLDEPTAQLDVRSEAAFYDRFLEIATGVTTVVISHRFSTVRRAERIAVIDDGRLKELGSHRELLAAGGTYAEMFALQAERFSGLERRRT
jgi:ATP-binding cassette subfamily B protein